MKGHLRKEKTCLNCGAEVNGRYCPECAQENREPRENFGSLIYHFFSDFTHFDSKFFKTIKYLFSRPGFLTKEYLAGRRMRYLHPIRMYIFISFVFFLCYSFLKGHSGSVNSMSEKQQQKEIRAAIDSIKIAALEGDTTAIKATTQRVDQIITGLKSIEEVTSVEEFDSTQNALPEGKRMHGLERLLARKQVAWKQKYGDKEGVLKEKLIHDIPKVMFILLPLFAWFLQWFYRKGWYYTDHAIFSLHFHSFAFLLNLLLLILARVFHAHFFERFFIYLLFLYLIIALRNVYQRSWRRTVFKGLWISLLYAFSIGIILLLTVVVIFIIG